MKKLFLAFVACLGFMTVNAEDVVTFEGNVVSGEAGSITVSLNTENPKYSAYQFYIYVPTGLTWAKASKRYEDGDIVNEDSENGMSYGLNKYTTKKTNDGWLGEKEGYDCYLFTAYDGSQATFATGGGTLITISYSASEVASLPIQLSHIVLSETDGKTQNMIEDIVWPTAVNSIKADGQAAAGAVYGIDGIRKAQVTKGLNIVDGKKVVK